MREITTAPVASAERVTSPATPATPVDGVTPKSLAVVFVSAELLDVSTLSKSEPTDEVLSESELELSELELSELELSELEESEELLSDSELEESEELLSDSEVLSESELEESEDSSPETLNETSIVAFPPSPSGSSTSSAISFTASLQALSGYLSVLLIIQF